MKKFLILLIIPVLFCSCTRTGSSSGTSADIDATNGGLLVEDAHGTDATDENGNILSQPETTRPRVPADTVIVEEQFAAESGDAFLMIADKEWKAQYFGKNSDNLAYDAKLGRVKGDGNYSVKVTADTTGFRKETGEYTPSGLKFMAVAVKNGKELLPNKKITVNSVKVDGKAVNLLGVPPTTFESDGSMRIIFYSEYDEKYVNTDDFSTWSSIEVEFSVI